MTIYLTTADVCEIANLPQQTLDEWVNKGFITPAIPGKVGRGNPNKFSVTQAVGIAVARQLRHSERGCALKYVGSVVEAFGNVNEEWLIKTLKEDGHYFVMPHYKKPLLRGADFARTWPNVATTFKDVSKFLKEKRRAQACTS